MRTTVTSTVLPCGPETVWAAFLNEAYVRSLYLEELQYRAFAIIEIGTTSRRLRIVPKMKLPAPVARLIGDSFAYEEHSTLDRETNEWRWRIVQPTNLGPTSKPRKDLVTVSGTTRLEAVGGQCRRSDDVLIEARVFGLGGLIERSIDQELRRGWAKERALLTQWLNKPRDSAAM